MEKLSIEMDIIEKRSILDRISKLEEIVMKYSDIENKSEGLESIERKVIIMKNKVELIEKSFNHVRETDDKEHFVNSVEVDNGNTDKVEYLKQKMKTVNKTLELVEKRMVVDRISNIEYNVEILCKLDVKTGEIERIEEEVENLKSKFT